MQCSNTQQKIERVKQKNETNMADFLAPKAELVGGLIKTATLQMWEKRKKVAKAYGQK